MFSSSERKRRKLILREIRRNGLLLASLVGDERYLRKFQHVKDFNGKTYSLMRLKRLRRPLWLGSDGYVYRVDPVWPGGWSRDMSIRRAKLKRRDYAGLERVNDVLILVMDEIIDKSPFRAGIIMEM